MVEFELLVQDVHVPTTTLHVRPTSGGKCHCEERGGGQYNLLVKLLQHN